MEGLHEPLALREGDCFLLPHGRPFRLASDLAVAPIDYAKLLRDGDMRSWNGGGECLIVGGHFALSEAQARLLLGGEAIKVVARSLGYGSDSAFGARFRRMMGSSPGKHSRTEASRL